MANSPGDLACGRRAWAGTVMWLFLVAAVLCRRADRGQAGAPAAPRRQARARTNELDARQAAADDKERGRAVPGLTCTEVAGWFPRRAWSAEWSHMHPFGSCPLRAGAHD